MNLVESMGLIQKTDNQNIEMIDISNLHENPGNFYDTTNLNELKQAIIIAGGVKQNLIVKHYHHNEYMIVSGHRRYLAVKQLIEEGKEISHELPCLIEQDEDMADLLLITTNSATRKLTDFERVEQFEHLEKIYKKWREAGMLPTDKSNKRNALSRMIGESRTNIARLQAISNSLLDKFKVELKYGTLGISVAYELSKLPKEDQAELYKKCMSKGGLTLEDAYEARRKLDIRKRISGNKDQKEEEESDVDAADTTQERREYIPLKNWTGCEILLKTKKIDGEYVTVVQYRTPEHSGERDVGSFPNIASARTVAIQMVKNIDNRMHEALVDAGLINEEGIPTYSAQQSNKAEDDEWEDAPDEYEETVMDKSEEPDESIIDFFERTQKMRHPRVVHSKYGESCFGLDNLFEIGVSDKNGNPLKELDIVDNGSSIGVIVYKADELAYGIAVRGQMKYVDAIIGDNIWIVGNILINPEVLQQQEGDKPCTE